MNSKKKYISWEKELLEFVNTKPISPPAHLSEEIRIAVKQDLAHAIWFSFAKFVAIQACVASLTLFLCPQFEIGFTSHDFLADLIQHSDGAGFMIICGAFFLSTGAILATFLLNISELKNIEKSKFIYFPIVTLIALLFFYFMGADLNLSFSLPWFGGGTLGSIIGFELVKKIRLQVVA